MHKVIELIRVSTAGQAADDRASIPAQRAINRRTAQAFGLKIIQTIEITDVSGAQVLRASEMHELLRVIERPDVHGVITREFSRLMRPEQIDDFVLLGAFQKTNTILYLPEGPLDFNNKTGRLMGVIRAAIAGLERSEILDRIWQAKEEKRRRGEFAQAPVCLPFGVSYDRQRGWAYTPEAEKLREAFNMVLAGETSYKGIAKRLGFEAPGLAKMLRNPIYTGWRVIDQKRDLSPGGRLTKADGRQGDRKKIKRAPEDVIRVQVIREPLISEADHVRVLEILDTKKQRHWRYREGTGGRFTYNGFLICASCGEIIYTALMRDDYYVCRARRTEKKCQAPIMRRDRMEEKLDDLFSKRLTDRAYLKEIIDLMTAQRASTRGKNSIQRLRAQIEQLKGKRVRVIDAYTDGAIDRNDRDLRLMKIDNDIHRSTESLLREAPDNQVITPESLSLAFVPLLHWRFLGREHKRRLLSALIKDIHVEKYNVHGITLRSLFGFSNEVTHTGMDSLVAEIPNGPLYLPLNH